MGLFIGQMSSNLQVNEHLTFIVPFPSPTNKRCASAKNSKQEATAANNRITT